MTLLCEHCGPRPISEYMRVFDRVPVFAKGAIVGWVSVVRHRTCRKVTALPLRV